MRLSGFFALLVVLLVAVVGDAAGARIDTEINKKTHTVNGTLTLESSPGGVIAYRDSSSKIGGEDCRGADDASDIDDSTRVTLTNQKGKTLGVAVLSQGKVANVRQATRYAESFDCVFLFTFKRVPAAPFYGVAIGARPPETFAKSEIKEAGWRVGLTLP